MIINYLQPQARYYSADKEILENYDDRIDIYNKALEDYKTQAGIYQGRVDDYNAVVKAYNDDLDAWKKSAEAYNAAIAKWNEGPRTTAYEDMDYYVASPGEWTKKSPDAFGYSPPAEPQDPGFAQKDVDEFLEYAQDRAKRRAEAQSYAQQAMGRGNMGFSGLGGSGEAINIASPGEGAGTQNTAGLAVGFEEGGMVPGLAFHNSIRPQTSLTRAIGEDGGGGGLMATMTTQAIGEDGGGGLMATTMAMGEEAQAPVPVSRPPALGQMQGVGGLFEQMNQNFSREMGMMQSQPLNVYKNYLQQTYVGPQVQQENQKVDHFVDLVDQAERAHFGVEESFGYGGGPMSQQFQQQIQQGLPQPYQQQAQAQFEGANLQGLGSLTAQLFSEGGAVTAITQEDLTAMRQKVMNDYGFDPVQVAMDEGVDPELFLRVMWTENKGRQGPVSRKGAIGLMQLMPETAKGLGVDPNNPLDNARGGARFLKQMLAEFKSVPLALAAYNAGPGNVRKYGGVPPFEETRNYVAQIHNVATGEILPSMGDFFQMKPGADPSPKPKLRPEGIGTPGYTPTPQVASEYLIQAMGPRENTAPDPMNIPMLQKPQEEEEASNAFGDFYKDYSGYDLTNLPLRRT